MTGTASELGTAQTDGTTGSPDTGLVAGLAAEASALIDRLPGPLRRVRVQLGEAEVEVEWATPEQVQAAAPAPAAFAPGPVAVSGGDWLTPPDAGDGNENGPIPGAIVVEAPVVGVFYRSPSPDEPPFVELGERVEVGQQLGIVEAMKLMNPIQAETAGVLAAVHVETGQGVEFGQPLFEILPDQT
ncbi:MAG TPA: biotin/lipoyl-containing protein [Kineosporiaceae bacterium]|nr:biotin/lipoyl-containing protein [Kineosporiaceae bacterium]